MAAVERVVGGRAAIGRKADITRKRHMGPGMTGRLRRETMDEGH